MPLQDLQRIKALAHPLRLSVINVLKTESQPSSIRKVAELINQKPTKLHYHFRLLEAAGFIEVADTREINGITERFYRLAGEDPDIVLSFMDNPEAVAEVIPLLEHKAREIIRRIPLLDRKNNPVLTGTIKDLYLQPEHAPLAKQALENLLAHKVAQLPEAADENLGEPYDLMVFLVPRARE